MGGALERVVLVTGAASGIGAACARRLAAPGTGLLLHTRARTGEVEAVAAQCAERGAACRTVTADLAPPGAGAALVERARAEFGRLDQIVSNAGFARRAAIAEVPRVELDRALATMAGALYEMIGAATDALAASPRGAIVAISSFVADRFRADSNFPTTAAAKAAVEAIAKAAAAELAARRVTVNCVAPGYTRKDATGHSALGAAAWRKAADDTPLGRIAEPDDVAAMVEFLLGPHARHVTGQVIRVDGGLSLG